MGFIYGLKDPITNHIRYIGKSNNPQSRFYRHIKESKDFNNKTHKANWIRILLKQGLKPDIVLIDEVPKEQINFWEKHYIKLYKNYENAFGYDLTNSTEGGDGGSIKGHKKSETTKKKMSEYWTKFRNENTQVITKEQKEKISNSLKEAYKTGKIKSKKGKVLTKEHISKISESMKKVAKKKPILQYDLNNNFIKEWEDILNTAKTLNLSDAHIGDVCKGKRKKCGGFVWKYKE